MATLTAEQIMKLAREQVAVLVVGASAMRPLRPGRLGGVFCLACGGEIQLTANGHEQVKAGGMPLCSTCGIPMANALADINKVGGVMIGPEGEKTLANPDERGPMADQIDLLRMAHPYKYPD